MKRYRLPMLWLVLFPLVCSGSGDFREGTVLDDETQVPIAGAMVIVRWQDRSLGRGPSACVHAESAITDTQGRYRVSAWQPPTALPGIGITPVVTVHQKGYQQTRLHLRTHEIQYLKRSTQARKARLDYLWHISELTDCHAAGAGQKNLALKRALYQEASEIAETEDEKDIVSMLRAAIDANEK